MRKNNSLESVISLTWQIMSCVSKLTKNIREARLLRFDRGNVPKKHVATMSISCINLNLAGVSFWIIFKLIISTSVARIRLLFTNLTMLLFTHPESVPTHKYVCQFQQYFDSGASLMPQPADTGVSLYAQPRQNARSISSVLTACGNANYLHRVNV